MDEGRYRIYRFNPSRPRNRRLQMISSTDTPQGLGLALVTHREEGEWGDDGNRVGVRDSKTGVWIIDPFVGSAIT